MTARGEALGSKVHYVADSPERARQSKDCVALSGLKRSWFGFRDPGRCPGLSHCAALRLKTTKSEGLLIVPRQTRRPSLRCAGSKSHGQGISAYDKP